MMIASTYYLTSSFTGGLPKDEPLNQLSPLVEFSFDTLRGQNTVATIKPGFAYLAVAWQFAAEAVVPLNREAGSSTGFRAQLPCFLDDLIPNSAISLTEASSRGNKLMNHKVQRISSIFAVLVISSLFNAASSAQSPMEWKKCLGLEGPIVDTVIDGCTTIIQSGQEPRERLATAFDNRGVAYRRKGEYDRALRDYEQAIRLNPSSATAYNNRGIIYRIKNEYARAIADYDEAIWLKNGDYPAAYYNRALAYADKGEYELSLRDFDVVMRFNPRNALALYARGLTLLKKGDTAAGKNDISAAKAINPDIAEQFDHSESPSR